MYNCILWGEFIDSVVVFGCYCVTPITPIIIRANTK